MEAFESFNKLSEVEKQRFFQTLCNDLNGDVSNSGGESLFGGSPEKSKVNIILENLKKTPKPSSGESSVNSNCGSSDSKKKQKTLDGWLIKRNDPHKRTPDTSPSQTSPSVGKTLKPAVNNTPVDFPTAPTGSENPSCSSSGSKVNLSTDLAKHSPGESGKCENTLATTSCNGIQFTDTISKKCGSSSKRKLSRDTDDERPAKYLKSKSSNDGRKQFNSSNKPNKAASQSLSTEDSPLLSCTLPKDKKKDITNNALICTNDDEGSNFTSNGNSNDLLGKRAPPKLNVKKKKIKLQTSIEDAALVSDDARALTNDNFSNASDSKTSLKLKGKSSKSPVTGENVSGDINKITSTDSLNAALGSTTTSKLKAKKKESKSFSVDNVSDDIRKLTSSDGLEAPLDSRTSSKLKTKKTGSKSVSADIGISKSQVSAGNVSSDKVKLTSSGNVDSLLDNRTSSKLKIKKKHSKSPVLTESVSVTDNLDASSNIRISAPKKNSKSQVTTENVSGDKIKLVATDNVDASLDNRISSKVKTKKSPVSAENVSGVTSKLTSTDSSDIRSSSPKKTDSKSRKNVPGEKIKLASTDYLDASSGNRTSSKLKSQKKDLKSPVSSEHVSGVTNKLTIPDNLDASSDVTKSSPKNKDSISQTASKNASGDKIKLVSTEHLDDSSDNRISSKLKTKKTDLKSPVSAENVSNVTSKLSSSDNSDASSAITKSLPKNKDSKSQTASKNASGDKIKLVITEHLNDSSDNRISSKLKTKKTDLKSPVLAENVSNVTSKLSSSDNSDASSDIRSSSPKKNDSKSRVSSKKVSGSSNKLTGTNDLDASSDDRTSTKLKFLKKDLKSTVSAENASGVASKLTSPDSLNAALNYRTSTPKNKDLKSQVTAVDKSKLTSIDESNASSNHKTSPKSKRKESLTPLDSCGVNTGLSIKTGNARTSSNQSSITSSSSSLSLSNYEAFCKLQAECSRIGLNVMDILQNEKVQNILNKREALSNDALIFLESATSASGEKLPVVHTLASAKNLFEILHK